MHIGIVSNSNQFPIKFSKKLGVGHIHTAEEEALYYCITILKNNEIDDEITIFSDQNSLVSIINSNSITSKILKSFPKVQEIKDFIETNNINLKWVKGTNNNAHNLVADTYKGIFYKRPYEDYNQP